MPRRRRVGEWVRVVCGELRFDVIGTERFGTKSFDVRVVPRSVLRAVRVLADEARRRPGLVRRGNAMRAGDGESAVF